LPGLNGACSGCTGVSWNAGSDNGCDESVDILWIIT
jgi:hypothetical protein